jgi:2-iminobutanoate/2-iminopropanoate deaminase
MKKAKKTNKIASAPHIFSQAIELNGLVFVSGQVGADVDWKLVDGGVATECKKAIENIKDILAESNVGLDQIVKATIYVTDISSAQEINEVYSSFFSDPLPAREMVEVKALPLGARIEISVIASQNQEILA